MEKEYRIFCRCIEDIIKFEECETCPHYRNDISEYCTYTENND